MGGSFKLETIRPSTPDYNDSQWQPIDPAKDVHDLLPLWKTTLFG
jgi:hypothetical protein